MARVCFIFLLIIPFIGQTQSNTVDVEQLKREVLLLQSDVENIQINLNQSQNKFKRGIALATLGYTVTIAGGLMLGRKNDDLGKGLLIAGGATGITGTIMMVDAFKYLGRAGRVKAAQK
jgi:RNase P/RNase MRP subunit p29